MKLLVAFAFFVLFGGNAFACELCAIYSAASARVEARGFIFNVSELFIVQTTTQIQGDELEGFPFLSEAYLNTWWTHFVPGYNISPRMGINVSIPYIYRDFRRTEFLTTGGIIDEHGSESGIGDVSLIGRFAP